jgi:membrane protease YdiL (CAAX protease family)
MLSNLVETLFVLLLVAGVPALSYITTRGSHFRLLPRSALYVSAVFSQALLAALGTAVVLVTLRSFSAIGFRTVAAADGVRWTVGLAAGCLGAMAITLWLERCGWWPAESELVNRLVPETAREKLWGVLVLAPTAAFAEEYLYRGYLLTVLSRELHSVPWGWAISSAAFGLAHLYQGLSGAARAALLGALLAYPVVLRGSLYPSMAAHFVIDAVALAWLGPVLLRRTSPP